MRLITFILSSGIALTWIPACASAQSLQPGIPPGMWVPHCPKNEGDQVCARDAVPIVQESRPAPSNALMAASGGLAARKTQPDDQPTEIPTETDDTRTAGGEEGAQEVLG